MDRTGKVNGAYRKLRVANDEVRVRSLVPWVGANEYAVDRSPPPWQSMQPSEAWRPTGRTYAST